jgi:hypothetical protein
MIERAIAARVPFSWVAADAVDGVSEIEMAPPRPETPAWGRPARRRGGTSGASSYSAASRRGGSGACRRDAASAGWTLPKRA